MVTDSSVLSKSDQQDKNRHYNAPINQEVNNPHIGIELHLRDEICENNDINLEIDEVEYEEDCTRCSENFKHSGGIGYFSKESCIYSTYSSYIIPLSKIVCGTVGFTGSLVVYYTQFDSEERKEERDAFAFVTSVFLYLVSEGINSFIDQVITIRIDKIHKEIKATNNQDRIKVNRMGVGRIGLQSSIVSISIISFLSVQMRAVVNDFPKPGKIDQFFAICFIPMVISQELRNLYESIRSLFYYPFCAKVCKK